MMLMSIISADNNLDKMPDRAKIKQHNLKIVGTTSLHPKAIDNVKLSLPMLLMGK